MDVIIVNHNTRDHLRACLASLEPEWARQVIVVDNASTDGSAEMVEREFSWVALLAASSNPGYGAAANRAITQCRSPYVLLLNSDTRLRPGTLRALPAYFEQHPRVAIVGPRLLNPDGSLQPSCYSFPTPLRVFLEESALHRLVRALPVVRSRYERTWAHDRSRRVDWVLGAALAIRREAFEGVGGFDESFFLYAEEVDLCFRLRAAGWEAHFTPEAAVVHAGGASTGQRRAEMAVQFFRSLVRFYRRHYSAARLFQLIMIMKSIVLLRWLRDAARLRLRPAPADRERIAENVAAWRRILWSSPAAER
jgi:GT2 family glycosyltransferase